MHHLCLCQDTPAKTAEIEMFCTHNKSFIIGQGESLESFKLYKQDNKEDKLALRLKAFVNNFAIICLCPFGIPLILWHLCSLRFFFQFTAHVTETCDISEYYISCVDICMIFQWQNMTKTYTVTEYQRYIQRGGTCFHFDQWIGFVIVIIDCSPLQGDV